MSLRKRVVLTFQFPAIRRHLVHTLVDLYASTQCGEEFSSPFDRLGQILLTMRREPFFELQNERVELPLRLRKIRAVAT